MIEREDRHLRYENGQDPSPCTLARATSAAAAEAHTARLWPSVRAEPLGRWTVRIDAREDGPRLKRANSCLAMNDPGFGVETALAKVVSRYDSVGRPPLVQVRTDTLVEREVLAAGWVAEPGDSHFMMAGVQRLRELLPTPGDRVEVVARGGAVSASVMGDAAPAAHGVAKVDGEWLGVHGLFVDPLLRRRRLAQGVLGGLVSHDAARGCLVAWLHVEVDNDPALSLYRKLGFVVHHSCRYYAPPRLTR